MKQKLSHPSWARQTNRRKEPKRKHMNQRPTDSHIQESHKNTKFKTWCQPVQALGMLLQSL